MEDHKGELNPWEASVKVIHCHRICSYSAPKFFPAFATRQWRMVASQELRLLEIAPRLAICCLLMIRCSLENQTRQAVPLLFQSSTSMKEHPANYQQRKVDCYFLLENKLRCKRQSKKRTKHQQRRRDRKISRSTGTLWSEETRYLCLNS